MIEVAGLAELGSVFSWISDIKKADLFSQLFSGS